MRGRQRDGSHGGAAMVLRDGEQVERKRVALPLRSDPVMKGWRFRTLVMRCHLISRSVTEEVEADLGSRVDVMVRARLTD